MKFPTVILSVLCFAGCSSASRQTNDVKEVEQDFREVLKWYQKAADQGNAGAQHNLGWMYYDGRGVEQDFKEASKWYQKAAEQGHWESQINLGIAYQGGQGVAKDIINAYIWFTIASSNGSKLAGKYRDNIALYMMTNQIIEAQRTAREMLEINPKLVQKKKSNTIQ